MSTRLSGQRVVPFIGVYSTQEHPLALVFEFMQHLNLGEYLRNNRSVSRLDLVRPPSSSQPHQRSLSILISAVWSSACCGEDAQRQRRSRKPQDCTNIPLPQTLVIGSHLSRQTSSLTVADTSASPALEQFLLRPPCRWWTLIDFSTARPPS